jgi:Tfp pilus assembly protein PilO
MTISTRERQLLRLAVLAILGLVISRVLWLPLLGARRAAEARLAEVQTRRQSIQRNLAAREAVERNFVGLQDQLQKQRSNEEELSVFLRSLSQALLDLSLQTKQIRPLPSEVQPFYKKHTVQIEVSGPVGSFAKMLGKVSESKLPIRLERFEVTGGTSSGRVDATLWISELILLEQSAGGEGT